MFLITIPIPEGEILMINKAIRIASSAHEGQADKAGEPYILHPLRVMLSLKGEV